MCLGLELVSKHFKWHKSYDQFKTKLQNWTYIAYKQFQINNENLKFLKKEKKSVSLMIIDTYAYGKLNLK